MTDANQSIQQLENALRDILTYVGKTNLGDNWVEESGVEPRKIGNWQRAQRRERENSGQADPRIMYYSDFADLKDVCALLWDHGVSDIFSNQEQLIVLLDLVKQYRNGNAHSRGLLPFQHSLIIGISGKIRTEITRYMSEIEAAHPYYARLDSVADNLGNTWALGESKVVICLNKLRIYERLEFTVYGTDPRGGQVEFAYMAVPNQHIVPSVWGTANDLGIELNESNVSRSFSIHIAIRTDGRYGDIRGLMGKVSDVVVFNYEVLAPDY